LVFTFVMILSPQTFVPGLGALRPGLLAAAVALATYLVDRLRRQRPLLPRAPGVGIAAVLALWSLLTVPWSYWPGGSAEILLDAYLKTLVVFWLLVGVVTTTTRLRRVALALTLMAAPLAGFALRQFGTGQFAEASGSVKRIVGFESALTQNPNDLALMLNLILPLTLALALSERRPLRRLLLLGGAALDAAAVILTFSRAGFLCLLTTGAIYFARLVRRPGRVGAIAVLLIGLTALPFLPAGYGARLGTIFDLGSDPTGSAQERRTDTLAAIGFVARHPVLGAGIGMNILALNEMRGAHWRMVHNVYLEYAVDLGLPGLALFVALLLTAWRAASLARRRADRAGQHDLFHLSEGLQVSLAAFALAAIFHPVAYHLYFYYIAGLAIAARGIAGVEAAA
jgi:O-antigen ligase